MLDVLGMVSLVRCGSRALALTSAEDGWPVLSLASRGLCPPPPPPPPRHYLQSTPVSTAVTSDVTETSFVTYRDIRDIQPEDNFGDICDVNVSPLIIFDLFVNNNGSLVTVFS